MIHQAIQMTEQPGDNDSGKPDDGEQPGDNDSSSNPDGGEQPGDNDSGKPDNGNNQGIMTQASKMMEEIN